MLHLPLPLRMPEIISTTYAMALLTGAALLLQQTFAEAVSVSWGEGGRGYFKSRPVLSPKSESSRYIFFGCVQMIERNGLSGEKEKTLFVLDAVPYYGLRDALWSVGLCRVCSFGEGH